MAGHSKWANIKHRKGAQDAKRGKIFNRIAKAIIVAAQNGGGDPEMNGTLKVALEQARAANMPKDNIERAIKRGTGETGDGLKMEEVIYEALSPEGVAMMILCTTDNTNRSLTEVKTALKKNNGKFVPSGSVSFQFQHVGQILLDISGHDADEVELAAIDAGAEDVEIEDETCLITTAVANFTSTQEKISADYTVTEANLIYLPSQTIELDDEKSASYESFFDIIEEVDDVTEIFDNRSHT